MLQQNWVIRQAEEKDLEALVAGNAAIARETEGLELDDNTLRNGIREILNNAARGFYVVAEAEGRVVGQTMVTYEWSDWRNGCFWWIQSVHVVPEHRGQGLFKALYAHVQERARAQPDVCGLRLYVERDNEKAHRAYVAVGMKQCPYHMFEVTFRPMPPSSR